MILGISGKKQSGKDLVGKIIQWLVSNSTIPFNDWINISTNTRNTYSHWIIKGFADNLKDMTCIMIGCTRDELEDESFKNKELDEEWDMIKCYSDEGSHFPNFNFNNIDEYNTFKNSDDGKWYDLSTPTLAKLTPRMILQQLGTEVGRNIHPNIWINSLMKDYQCRCGDDLISRDIRHVVFDNCKIPNWIITDTRFENEVKAIEDRDGFIIRVNRYPMIPLAKGNGETTNMTTFNHQSEIELDNHSFKYTIDNNGTTIELISKVKEILIKEGLIK